MRPFLPSDPSVSPQCVLDTLYTTNEENVCNFGFTVDPTWSRWDRVRNVILQMHPRCYFNRLTQMSYHNLCLTLIPPPGTCLLLGMSEKYCIKRGCPHGTDVMFKRNLSRFARSVRIRLALQHLHSHYNTLTLTTSLIFQDFTFLQNGNPLRQMPMSKPVLWNLLKDLNDLHCTHSNNAAIISI
jgi:hypothetical protein